MRSKSLGFVTLAATLALFGAAKAEDALRTLTGHTGFVRTVAVTPDGQTIVSGSDDYAVKLWRLSDGLLLRTLTGFTKTALSVGVTPDGQMVVSGSYQEIRVWRSSDGTLVRRLPVVDSGDAGHVDWVSSVAITPDGQTIVSGSYDNTIKVWRLSDGRLLRTLTGHTAAVNSIAITPDGQTIVSGSDDNTIKAWRLSDGQLLRTVTGHTLFVYGVAASSDGQTIVSGGLDGKVKVWRLSDWVLLRTLTAHADGLYALALTPDGQTIVSAGYKEIKVWRLSDGQLLRTLTGHTDFVDGVAVTPDGQMIVSGSLDKTVKVWWRSGVPTSGTISTTTWTKTNSPYRVTGAVTVPAGNTLTIEPGVDVLFDANVQFLVQGNIKAIGTVIDSIRFAKGTATEWRGVRITGADSSTIAYARFSDGHAYGSDPDDRGGALFVGQNAKLGLTHSVFVGIRADDSGGGVYGDGHFLSGAPSLTVANCTFRNNAAAWGGGLVAGWDVEADVTDCIFTGNSASSNGGGVAVWYATAAFKNCVFTANAANQGGGLYIESVTMAIMNCTITGNSAPYASGMYNGGTTTIKNSIVWGNNPALQASQFSGNAFTATYSDIQRDTGVYTGVGNINADPLFVNATAGDFRLEQGSPCVGTGESGANMGRVSAVPLSLSLPTVDRPAGSFVDIRVLATADTVRSASLVFTANPSIFAPGAPLLVQNALQGNQNEQMSYTVRGDSVFITVSADEPVSLRDQMLVFLRIQLGEDAAPGTGIPLLWAPSLTSINENPVAHLVDGLVTVRNRYGDVTGDGTLASLDASHILQYAVGTRAEIDAFAADVTGNGSVSSFDAARILVKILDPERMLPRELFDQGLFALGGKPAAALARSVRRMNVGGAWVFSVDDATGVMSGDLELVLRDDSPVELGGSGLLEYRREGRTLFVSFVHDAADGNALFTFSGGGGTPPEIAQISFNEGAIPAELNAPVPFSLSQNSPNPFNPSTTLRFGLPESGHVRLAVYDVTGALVRTLVDETFLSGSHSVVWDGRDANGREVASGVYVYRLTAKQGVVTRRMVLLR
jgi:WD40 repeat protein